METQAPRTTHWLYSKSGGCRAGDGSGWYTPAIEAVKSSHINSVGAGCPCGTLTLPVTCTPFSILLSRPCGARTSPSVTGRHAHGAGASTGKVGVAPFQTGHSSAKYGGRRTRAVVQTRPTLQ